MSHPLDAHVAPGQVIGDRYEVEVLLGEGGLAAVYRVRHRELGSRHALKLLSWRKPSLQRRLVLEGRIQAQLRHPNIVAVTDLVEHDGQTGLLMELVEGPGDLEAWLDEHGAVPFEEAMPLFACMLSALAAAHDAGVAHRDLKPANVLLSGSGGTGAFDFVPKVADFGIAKLVAEESGGTRMGATMGTPGYLAPEQVEDSSSIDARTDIFALGAILYELLTGRQAFADPNTGRIEVSSTATRSPCPIGTWLPSCPPSVAGAIERALAKHPDDRFQDCRSFAEALYVDHPHLLERVLERHVSGHGSGRGGGGGNGSFGAIGPSNASNDTDRPTGTAATFAFTPTAAPNTQGDPPTQPGATPQPVRNPRRRRRWTDPTLIAAGVLAGGIGVGLLLGVWLLPPMARSMLTEDPVTTAPPELPPPSPVPERRTDRQALPPETASATEPTPATADVTADLPAPAAEPAVPRRRSPAPAPPARSRPPPPATPSPVESPVEPALPTPPPPESTAVADVPAPMPAPASAAPRPAIDPPDLKGTWAGTGSGHQLELSIPDQEGERFDGTLTRFVGGRSQKEAARGTVTVAGTIEIRSGTWRFQGRVEGERLSGTVTRGGRSMGDWFLEPSR